MVKVHAVVQMNKDCRQIYEQNGSEYQHGEQQDVAAVKQREHASNEEHRAYKKRKSLHKTPRTDFPPFKVRPHVPLTAEEILPRQPLVHVFVLEIVEHLVRVAAFLQINQQIHNAPLEHLKENNDVAD